MSSRLLVTGRGSKHRLPIFLPVYQPHRQQDLLAGWADGPVIDGCIVNSYFLYKRRELRVRLVEQGLHDYLGFSGLVTTDSGAFQGFTRKLYLDNRDIVRFQDRIGSDVLAPLDLVTPPGDSKAQAEAKLLATEKRIRQALKLAERGTVAAVAQGGRFLDLRRRSVRTIRDMGISYLALGSLVPFFGRNHDLRFAGTVAKDARAVIGPGIPIHLYGAGDPCELPFFVACGVTVFDSASYASFAGDGWYMTRYGALRDAGPLRAGEYRCRCPACADDPAEIPHGKGLFTHNLWTICSTVDEINDHLDQGTLGTYLEDILEVHDAWFPMSALRRSWQELEG